MSDSEHSTVTYTSISNDYEEPSDVGFLGVVVYRYDRLPMHPPSPDYVPGPEHPPSPDYVPSPEHPPSLDFVPEPTYPEFMPSNVDSPCYITEYDPDEDLKDNDEDPEEDPPNYPADRDDDEEEEEESSGDDADDEDEDEEEEEENLALADS
ncbi:hypothetical protein Tco_0341833, partial [Tanacetum coccineum]